MIVLTSVALSYPRPNLSTPVRTVVTSNPDNGIRYCPICPNLSLDSSKNKKIRGSRELRMVAFKRLGQLRLILWTDNGNPLSQPHAKRLGRGSDRGSDSSLRAAAAKRSEPATTRGAS